MKTLKYLLLSFLILNCGYTASAQTEADAVRIGAMLCLSGDCAEYGTNALKGAQLAVEEINSQGGLLGKKIELIIQDSHDTTPARTVSAFRKLITDPDINFILGPSWTVGGQAIAPLAAQEKERIFISPSVGVRDFNETAKNILNTWPHDEVATRKLANYAFQQGWKRAAIFSSEDPWVKTQSDIFEEEFQKLGGEITKRVEPLPGSRDLKAEALQIKNSNPDVIFFSNYQTDVFSRELRKIKCILPKLAILMEKERIKSAQGALEGTIVALHEKPADNFQQAFQRKFNTTPGISADTAYDAIKLYAQAVQETQSFTTEDTLNYLLSSVKNFQGASGTYSVKAKGSVEKTPVLWRIRGETYEKIK